MLYANPVINGIFVGALLGAIVLPGAQRLLPSSIWIDYHQIEVIEAEPGMCPRLLVNRTIHWPVEMSWNVQVLRWHEGNPNDDTDGEWRGVISGSGTDHYRPGDNLPVPLYLSWWLGDANRTDTCPWSTPGLYQLDQRWRLHTWIFRPRPINRSVDYEVREKE